MTKSAALKKFFPAYNSTETMQRFLLPILSIMCFASALLSITLNIVPFDDCALKIAMLFFNNFLALTSIKFCAESNKWDNKKYYTWSAIAFFAIASISLTASKYEIASLAVGLLFSISITPFFRKKVNDAAYCNFKAMLASNLFFAAAVAFILVVGTIVILSSVGYLFDIRINESIKISVVAVYLSLFVPLYILSSIPEKFHSKERAKHSKGVKFLTHHVLLPLVLLYAIILYAYILKIIFVWELPKGNLTLMIFGFGAVGILTHFLAHSANNGEKLVKLYCRYFYHFLVLPTLVLFLAIITRVSEYGVTEGRYFSAIIAIWFAASCSYVILHQSEKLKLVPIMVAALFIISSFGPWSASRFSGASQAERLRELLIAENLVQDNKIVKSENVKSFEYNKKISEIIFYLVSTKKIDLIKDWFPANSYINKMDDRYGNSYNDSQAILAGMGLYYVNSWQNEAPLKSLEFSMKNAPIFYDSINEVRGFDYVANFNLDSSKGPFRKIKTPDHDFKLVTFLNNNELIVSDRDKNGIVFDLQQLVEQLKNSSQNENDFIVYGENKKFHVKLLVSYIKATDTNNPDIKDYSISCVMLVKMLDK